MVGCDDEEEEPVYTFTVGGRNEKKIEVTVEHDYRFCSKH